MSLKIIGLGGMGYFALKRLAKNHEGEVDLLLMDTDRRSVSNHPRLNTLIIGSEEKGANGNPMKGREAAEAAKDALFEALAGIQKLILIAGMGRGTGSGAAQVVAYVAKEMRVPCKAFVSMPFSEEGKQAEKIAELGLSALERFVDDMVIVKHTIPKNSMGIPALLAMQEFLAFELYFHVLSDLP